MRAAQESRMSPFSAHAARARYVAPLASGPRAGRARGSSINTPVYYCTATQNLRISRYIRSENVCTSSVTRLRGWP